MRPASGYRVHGRIEWPEGARAEQKILHLFPKPAGGGGTGYAGPTPFAGDTFDYAALLPGRWSLTAMFQGGDRSRHASLEIEVTDHDVEDLVLRFPEGVTVSGVMRGAADLSGVRLNLEGAMGGGAAVSDNGSFCLFDVAPGTYRLHLWNVPSEGYVRAARWNGAEADPDALPIQGPGTLEIELGFDGAVVSGTVDPPRPGAVVQLWRGSRPAHFAAADQDSRFEIRGVAPGEYAATASRVPSGPQPSEDGERIRVSANQRLTLTLKLQ